MEGLSASRAGNGIYDPSPGATPIVMRKRLDPPDLLVFELALVLLVDLHTGILLTGVRVLSVKYSGCFSVPDDVGAGR